MLVVLKNRIFSYHDVGRVRACRLLITEPAATAPLSGANNRLASRSFTPRAANISSISDVPVTAEGLSYTAVTIKRRERPKVVELKDVEIVNVAQGFSGFPPARE